MDGRFPSRSLRDEKAHGLAIRSRIIHKISQTLFAQFRNCALFTDGELVTGGLWKNGIKIISVPAIEQINAGDVVRLPFYHQIQRMIYGREFHPST